MAFGWGKRPSLEGLTALALALESEDAHRRVYGDEEHQSKWNHELAAGAASFAGMKAYEDRQRKEGKTDSHAFAKETIAALVGAEVHKLAESKAMDEIDKIKAKHDAKENAHRVYDEHYVQGHGVEHYDLGRYRPHESYGRCW